jgi:hypothetical protein
VSDEFENMEEPEHGTHPEALDMESHLKERSTLPFYEYRPVFYKFPSDLAPLRPPDKVRISFRVYSHFFLSFQHRKS